MRPSTYLIFFLLVLFSCKSGNKNKVSDSPGASSQDEGAQPAKTDDLAVFNQLPAEKTGLDFVNQVTDSKEVNFFVYDAIYQGAGVGVGDFDNDGLPDLFFAGNMVNDRLYRNKGNLQFEDITAKAGIQTDNSWSTGVAVADVNGDGWLDIYVCKFLYPQDQLRHNKLYINNQNGTFSEKAAAYGIADPGYSIQANFFDYDRDGDLDLYVANQPPNATSLRSKLGNDKHFQFTDRLYRNENNKKFTEVTKAAGITNYSFSLSATVSDLNQDGWPDIYIANDYEEPDFYYQNNGNGTFTDIAHTALRHISNFSMGCDIADFNNDGWPDIYAPDMVANDNFRLKANMSGMNPTKFWALANNGYHYQYMFNTLQLNNGNGSFSEIAQLAGISNTDWSWSSLFTDLDNDGFKDLLVTNGLLRDVSNNDFRNKIKEQIQKQQQENLKTGTQTGIDPMQLLQYAPSERLANYAFRNKGDLSFQDRSSAWHFDFKGWSQGAAYADLDNDGDIDVVTNNINDPATLYNNTIADNKINRYLRVKLIGSSANPFAYGAKVVVYLADGSRQMMEVSPIRGFMSTSENVLHFGMGNLRAVDRIEITWPDGQQSTLRDQGTNQIVEINYKDAHPAANPASAPKPFFVKTNKTFPFRHTENEYDDYNREILLPYKLSHLGPKIAAADVNADGLEDLYITGAAGAAGALFIQRSGGRFAKAASQPWDAQKASEEINALFFDADSDGDPDLYVACGGNEFPPNSPMYQDRLYLNDGKGKFSEAPLPKMTGSNGAVAAGDMDGDGDPDLFVGCRNIPGAYGHTGESVLLKNDKGVFTKITQQFAPELTNIGMVTDAHWFDYNKDGRQDLVVAGEWMPICLFENNGTGLENVTEKRYLNEKGWWNTIHVADMDQDGDEDLIVGNLGTNIKYKTSRSKPFKLYVKDFDENGSNDVYLGYYDSDGVCYPVRGRECSSQQMPFVKEEFKTYSAFAKADIESVLGRRKEGAVLKEATFFQSAYFENQGTAFANYPLPVAAQMAPIHGIAHYDCNRDGHLDLIVAGNFYHREIETTRSDAGTGQILLGDGKGRFEVLPPYRSGLMANKDVRDIKLVMTDTGRPLLIVANNNEEVEVFLLDNVLEG